MQRAQGVDKAADGESPSQNKGSAREETGEEVEASGDAIVIADAIFRGLTLMAEAMDGLAKAVNGLAAGDEHGPPQESETYLDGRPIK